ncbi:MAG: Spy/CpxP family protein refolding chaperone [Pseudomonadota bacterium]
MSALRYIPACVLGGGFALVGVWAWLAFVGGHGAHDHGSHAGHRGSYAGEQDRDISSLSAGDVAALEAGQGWGLAKSAELNGYPGPRHVLDLADELALTAAQRKKIKALFDEMSRAAKLRGTAFLNAERALTVAFRDKTITPEALAELTQAAGRARAKVRAVHLAAHLKTVAVLTPAQIATYNQRRGYKQAALSSPSSD